MREDLDGREETLRGEHDRIREIGWLAFVYFRMDRIVRDRHSVQCVYRLVVERRRERAEKIALQPLDREITTHDGFLYGTPRNCGAEESTH